MKGPDPKCLECGAMLCIDEVWIEDVGMIEKWYCPSCGWEED